MFDMSQTKNQERQESDIQHVWQMAKESEGTAYICGLLHKYIIIYSNILYVSICTYIYMFVKRSQTMASHGKSSILYPGPALELLILYPT